MSVEINSDFNIYSVLYLFLLANPFNCIEIHENNFIFKSVDKIYQRYPNIQLLNTERENFYTMSALNNLLYIYGLGVHSDF